MTATQNNTLAAWPKLPLPHGLGRNFVTAHALARSAIFSTQSYCKKAPRPQYLSKTKLGATKTSGIEVFQTAGHGLDQGDAEVFYELLRRVFNSGHEMHREAHVCFNRGELIKALGRAAGGKTRTLLDESLDRLFRAEFEFSVPGIFIGKSRLILKMYRRECKSETEHDYDVLLDVELGRLFESGQWTLLRRSELQCLKGNPVAKGVYAYYSTHMSPHPMLPATLQVLLGRDMQLSKFVKVLIPALAEVKKATGWAKCELELKGKYAGKVVVERGERARASASTGKPKASAPLVDEAACNAYGDI
ncbi:plasmid replication initiator TrfA [Burkholderia pseudomallei]|uniref:plasmid replication initiator TrfA n=1 Tax=Burkholderia pseudomallei TaxID=28450 RepID=UPI000F084EBE|nr:plasmid replication initiator TrfA [Burkholderia pseudomallei]VBO96032.1 TrfA family protein [Burkholderia pseudomallei]VBP04875.1 TrfA family protein [Burkholderia pseudomallei]